MGSAAIRSAARLAAQEVVGQAVMPYPPAAKYWVAAPEQFRRVWLRSPLAVAAAHFEKSPLAIFVQGAVPGEIVLVVVQEDDPIFAVHRQCPVHVPFRPGKPGFVVIFWISFVVFHVLVKLAAQLVARHEAKVREQLVGFVHLSRKKCCHSMSRETQGTVPRKKSLGSCCRDTRKNEKKNVFWISPL